MFSIIVCTDSNEGIGKNGSIPWFLPPDMKRFKKITSEVKVEKSVNSIIMGRKTWDSLPKGGLPCRINIVISKSLNDSIEGAYVVSSFDKALDLSKELRVEQTFVIGGGEIYKMAVKDNRCKYIYLTKLSKSFECDTYFNFPSEKFKLLKSENLFYEGLHYNNQLYVKNNYDELNYLNLLQNVLSEGIEKDDRTGVGIISCFGKSLQFNLKEGFPLLTSKFVPFKLTIKELLWFISGSTDNSVLKDQGVHIWDGNTTKEFIEKSGLPYEENDLGPMYGFQWRYSGAEYIDCKTDYSGKGVDQIKKVINTIRKDPCSRRIILSAYNVHDLDKMVLNPCHCMVQFYVDTVRGELSAQMYQRSADLFLGVPINIASYALLTHMIAHVCGLGVGKLVICFGDAHIYKNHLDAVETQLERKELVKPFPELRINRDVDEIEKFVLEDFEIVNYQREGRIKAPMAV
jgi:dihydrofolate reductase/thymidylate synthase